jgi:hypothetical protein
MAEELLSGLLLPNPRSNSVQLPMVGVNANCDMGLSREKGGTMADEPQGCARLSGSVVPQKGNNVQTTDNSDNRKERTMNIQVGQKAPEFIAPAYYKGKFTSVKLADYAGKWLLLCFYPGDFTFV